MNNHPSDKNQKDHNQFLERFKGQEKIQKNLNFLDPKVDPQVGGPHKNHMVLHCRPLGTWPIRMSSSYLTGI